MFQIIHPLQYGHQGVPPLSSLKRPHSGQTNATGGGGAAGTGCAFAGSSPDPLGSSLELAGLGFGGVSTITNSVIVGEVSSSFFGFSSIFGSSFGFGSGSFLFGVGTLFAAASAAAASFSAFYAFSRAFRASSFALATLSIF